MASTEGIPSLMVGDDLRSLRIAAHYHYSGVDLAEQLRMWLRRVVPVWQREGWLRDTGSFGLAVGSLAYGFKYQAIWNDPERLLGFGVYWEPDGEYRRPDGEQRVYEALCMLRPVARTGHDTMALPGNEFLDVPASRGQDEIPWGDLGRPGGVISSDGKEQVLLGVSTGSGRWDHRLAGLAADRLLEICHDARHPRA